MKWFLITLYLLPAGLQAQEFEVKKHCMGKGTHAMVVEHNDQFYVIETNRYFQRNWTISDLRGISFGGWRTLYYYDENGIKDHIQVKILSRRVWKYSGYPGAKAVCRQVTN